MKDLNSLSDNKVSRKNVLVVDGDISLAEKLSSRLREKGFQVTCANNGSDALGALERGWFDLIVLSVVLEGETDGFHLFKKIKEDPELARIPIIMESGKPGMKEMFQNMGAAEFFVKPYSMDSLIDKAGQFLG